MISSTLIIPTILLAIFLPFLLSSTTFRLDSSRRYDIATYSIIPAIIFSLVLLLSATSVNQYFFELSVAGFPLGFGFLLDQVSLLMLFLISTVAFVIIKFSKRYLDGDSGHGRFLIWLTATVSTVSCLVCSNNFLMYFCCWLGLSISLHQLLTFYPERKKAILCARKKFLISRLGDTTMLLAILVVGSTFKTLDFREIFTLLNQQDIPSLQLGLITFFLTVSALTKSAQFPFHTWLPDSLEVPTPVSAIMHAGIINGGGYLVIRLSPLFAEVVFANVVLVMFGLGTALFAMSVMITQTSVKKRLAYSTIGQMGFMIFQCGLGLYALALLHIIAHSYYKAYSFLRSGSTIEYGKQQIFHARLTAPNLLTSLGFMAVVLLICLFVIGLPGITLQIAYLPILLIWTLSACYPVYLATGSKVRKRPLALAIAGLLATALVLAYILLSAITTNFLSDIVALSWLDQLSWFTVSVVTVASLSIFCFFSLQVFANLLCRTKAGQRVFIHLQQGFYLKNYMDRFTQNIFLKLNRKTNANS